jgi:hypothetical protein
MFMEPTVVQQLESSSDEFSHLSRFTETTDDLGVSGYLLEYAGPVAESDSADWEAFVTGLAAEPSVDTLVETTNGLMVYPTTNA